MPEMKNRIVQLYRGGVFQDLTNRIRLIIRLMADRRVNPLFKLIPLASVVYLLFPDLAPGPIDDAALIWLATMIFVELCPPEVVEEHLATISGVIPGQWREVPLDSTSSEEGEIIEAEFREE